MTLNTCLKLHQIKFTRLHKKLYLIYPQDIHFPSSSMHNALPNLILSRLTIGYNHMIHSSWYLAHCRAHHALHVYHQSHGSFQSCVQAHEREPVFENEMRTINIRINKPILIAIETIHNFISTYKTRPCGTPLFLVKVCIVASAKCSYECNTCYTTAPSVTPPRHSINSTSP